MNELKGKAKMVRRVFRCPYIHIGAKKIAEIADTGVLSEEEQIAYAAEFVRRWNAFEEDGLVEGLVEALGHYIDDEECSFDHHGCCQTHGGDPCTERNAKAALAKAKPE